MLKLNLTIAVDQQSGRAGEVCVAEVERADGRPLDVDEFFEPEIEDAFASWWRGERPEVQTPESSPIRSAAALEPFSARPRELVVSEDSITLMGMEVWRICAQTDTRDALALMSRKTDGIFVRIRGKKLNEKLDRNPSNPIAKPFADTRRRCSEVMLDRGIECGNDDVFMNGAGGYHFREWIAVRVVGAWARALGIERDDGPAVEPKPLSSEPHVTPDHSLNERQRWILDQVRGGARLSQKDVLAHFRGKWNNSTVKRDLQGLRRRFFLKTDSDGYYVPADEDR